MSSNESTTILNSRNPPNLPPRYEIRPLTTAHADWANAIVFHSNVFYSTIWPLIYPENKTARLHQCMKGAAQLVNHQIASSMSFGIFDTEYIYKRPESEATSGKLYWDKNEDADRDTLLAQMDFPLVSVALSYDQRDPLDADQMQPLIEALPRFGTVQQIFNALDKRDPSSWHATRPNEVLIRKGTATRFDYAGAKLTKQLAQFVMREAKRRGYRAIQIQCLHDAVAHTWLNPPSPFRGEVVCEADLYAYWEVDEKKEVVYPFRPSKQVATRIYVHL